MKAFLLYPDQDVDPQAELPPQHEALSADLELPTLWSTMADGDAFLFDVAQRILLTSVRDLATIRYRQDVLTDCLAQSSTVRDIYDLAVAAIKREKREYMGLFQRSPDSVLARSVRVLEMFVEILKQLRTIADEHGTDFRSTGFTRFFAMLSSELDDDYFQVVAEYLKELQLRQGVLTSATLGKGAKATDIILREPPERTWRDRLPFGGPPSYSFLVAARDEAGFRALMDLTARGLNLAANAAATAVDHILSFFRMLRTELAFYVGCVNLHERLTEKGEPSCLPVPTTTQRSALFARGLYDVCLALRIEQRATGNDVDATDMRLVMITGANQGGKSTFLRSVGLAQLMAQSGMFVAASSLTVPLCTGVFTHFKREEDASMESGKLDEELARMSGIADHITTGGLLLCNESFAATNEREGSQIARQMIRALTDAGVTVFFVTHLFDLAHGFHREHSEGTLLLRAQRQPDGRRTFRIGPGEPLPTSFGEDSYRRIFGAAISA